MEQSFECLSVSGIDIPDQTFPTVMRIHEIFNNSQKSVYAGTTLHSQKMVKYTDFH